MLLLLLSGLTGGNHPGCVVVTVESCADLITAGSTATVSCVFSRASVATDPSSVTLRFRQPNGVRTDVMPVRQGVGVYKAQVDFDAPGTWEIEAIGTGSCRVTTTTRVFVRGGIPAPV